jgi:hypothetical protein
MKTGIDSASNIIENKIENKSNMNIQKAKNVVDKVKSGGSKVFNFSSKVLSTIIDPVLGKAKQLNRKLCEKIDNSDYRALRYLKGKCATKSELTNTSAVSIQNAFYGLSDAVKEVGRSFGEGATKIVNKKFITEEQVADKSA